MNTNEEGYNYIRCWCYTKNLEDLFTYPYKDFNFRVYGTFQETNDTAPVVPIPDILHAQNVEPSPSNGYAALHPLTETTIRRMADDFVVPFQELWTIQTVSIFGRFSDLDTAAEKIAGWTVEFYSHNTTSNLPGQLLYTFANLSSSNNIGNPH